MAAKKEYPPGVMKPPPRLLARWCAWLTVLAAAGTGAVASAAERYEPIRVDRCVEIEFPSQAVMRYVDRGRAQVMIMVDAEGRLADWMVIAYSNPLFAKSALDVIPQWKYEPARLHGRPMAARAELTFVFENNEIVRVISGEAEVARRFKTSAYRNGYVRPICRVPELDALPEVEVEVAPMPPDQLGARVAAGEVIVDYLVDSDGRVRMPLIVSSDDEAFSRSVLLAMSEWKYSAPSRKGAPVIAWLRYRFEFSPAPNPAPQTASLPAPRPL